LRLICFSQYNIPFKNPGLVCISTRSIHLGSLTRSISTLNKHMSHSSKTTKNSTDIPNLGAMYGGRGPANPPRSECFAARPIFSGWWIISNHSNYQKDRQW
jgi:hypothetical protein